MSDTSNQVFEQIKAARAEGKKLNIAGGGTKSFLERKTQVYQLGGSNRHSADQIKVGEILC